MIRIVWADAVQFIQQFLCDTFGVRVFHAENHSMSDAADQRKINLFFEPIYQEI